MSPILLVHNQTRSFAFILFCKVTIEKKINKRTTLKKMTTNKQSTRERKKNKRIRRNVRMTLSTIPQCWFWCVLGLEQLSKFIKYNQRSTNGMVSAIASYHEYSGRMNVISEIRMLSPVDCGLKRNGMDQISKQFLKLSKFLCVCVTVHRLAGSDNVTHTFCMCHAHEIHSHNLQPKRHTHATCQTLKNLSEPNHRSPFEHKNETFCEYMM